MFWLYNLLLHGRFEEQLADAVVKLNELLLTFGINIGLTPDSLSTGTLFTAAGVAILVVFANSILKGFSALRAALITIAVVFCFYTIFMMLFYAMGMIL